MEGTLNTISILTIIGFIFNVFMLIFIISTLSSISYATRTLAQYERSKDPIYQEGFLKRLNKKIVELNGMKRFAEAKNQDLLNEALKSLDKYYVRPWGWKPEDYKFE